MAQPMSQGDLTDDDSEQQLIELLSGLSDEQVAELADLAEAMHAEAGV